jgi:hypothetical protein
MLPEATEVIADDAVRTGKRKLVEIARNRVANDLLSCAGVGSTVMLTGTCSP